MTERNLAKSANVLFLTVVTLAMCANLFVSLISIKNISINIVVNLLGSQMIILVPGLIYYVFITKKCWPFRIYNKIRPVTVLLLIVFTWLILPLATAANVFSQIFTENEVMSISKSVLEMPLILMILIMGIVGPFSEEFVFRGLIYNSLKSRTERYIASGIVSALFFGLMHMNFNQFCYAFVLGVIFALINEILDSTWPSFICHAVVNTQNVLLLYIVEKVMSEISGKSVIDMYDKSMADSMANSLLENKIFMIMFFVVILMFAAFSAVLAAFLFYGIAKVEGKTDRIKMIFSKRADGEKKKLLYIAGYAAALVCIFVMFLLEPLIKFFAK